MSRDESIALVDEQAELITAQAQRIPAQDAQITALATRVAELMQANEDLADRLARLEHLLSRNSSGPPSKDDEPGKPPRPPRSKCGGGPKRRPDKQSGAPGFHLAWTDAPDEPTDLFPHGPCGCGQYSGRCKVGAVAQHRTTGRASWVEDCRSRAAPVAAETYAYVIERHAICALIAKASAAAVMDHESISFADTLLESRPTQHSEHGLQAYLAIVHPSGELR